MTLPLTKEVLKQAYEYLCSTPPFNKWNLPDSEDVVFKLIRHPAYEGWYSKENGKHIIAISSKCIGRTLSLMEVMAHEMIHLHQGDVKMDTPNTQHNAAFKKLAAKVCFVHGFDPKLF